MRIDLKCGKCHGNRLNLDEGLADDSEVTCSDCGEKIGTLAELKERVAAEVLKRRAERPASQPH